MLTESVRVTYIVRNLIAVEYKGKNSSRQDGRPLLAALIVNLSYFIKELLAKSIMHISNNLAVRDNKLQMVPPSGTA